MTICLIVIALSFVLLFGAIVALTMTIRKVVKRAKNISNCIEKRICPDKECYRCMHKVCEEEEMSKPTTLAADILEWGLLGCALWQKIKEKRR